MFKIGDFSKISQVSVRMLRHYDELGLLKPAHVDPFTDYRYYTADQLPRLNRIVALRELGFTLEQIARLLNGELTAEQLRGMLVLKRAEIEQQVQAQQEQLARVEMRLMQIELEGKMPNYEVVLKKVPQLHVASASGVIPAYGEDNIKPILGPLFDEVYEYAGRYAPAVKAGCGIAIYHDDGREHDILVEAVAEIDGDLPGNARVRVYDLPAVETMASLVHHGPFATLGAAYQAIMAWIEANGYRVVGPQRELNLEYERGGDQSKYVTEIQFPVVKV
jgi:DNA-binding transcriptional MerR regulator